MAGSGESVGQKRGGIGWGADAAAKFLRGAPATATGRFDLHAFAGFGLIGHRSRQHFLATVGMNAHLLPR